MTTASRSFGRFVVTAAAGRGGTADVYRAVESPGGRAVALKVASATPGAEDAIRREAIALRALSHPGIVGFVAEGVTEDDTRFLVTEWLEGESLAERLARAPLTEAEAMALGRALAGTLRYIHEAGFVHRDLKPANVMLAGGDLGRPKLVDFGFACRVEEPGLEGDALLRVSEVMGTPAYMAPEQARGDTAPDPRADVYGFGALLYRAVTGQAPFAGKDVVDTLTHLLFEDPPPLRTLAPKLSDPIAALIARAMRKEPVRRPRDGAALVEAFRALDGEPGPASIASMAVPRTIVCLVLCQLPASDPGGSSALAVWGRKIAIARETATTAGAELRLLGEGSVALFFDDSVGVGRASPRESVARATDVARELSSKLPGSIVAVTCAHGTTTSSATALVAEARSLTAGAAPGIYVDAVVDALLPPEPPRMLTATGRRLPD